MTLSDHIKKCMAIIEENPSAANMEVYNTSCLDAPLRFATSGVFVDKVYKNGDGDCGNVPFDEGDEGEECVVIEAF